MADRIEVGGVGINVDNVSELQAPFGGWKQSGIGSERGPEGLYTYLKVKHVRVHLERTL